MDELLERYKPPKLTQEEIYNMNNCKSIKYILKLKIFPKRKIQFQMASLVSSTDHLRKKWYQFYTKFSPKMEVSDYFTTHSLWSMFLSHQKLHKDITRKLQPIFIMKLSVNFLNKILISEIQQCMKRVLRYV